MCDSQQYIDNAGGATDWLFTVSPAEPIAKHDMAWMADINIAIEMNDTKTAAEHAVNYWMGITTSDPVWVYTAPSAVIMQVCEF
jgi:hypothetical protein